MIIIPANTLSGGFEVANSCRFNDDDSAYMHKTCSSAFDTDRFTISLWCKRGALGIETRLVSCDNADGSDDDFLKFDANDNIEFTIYGSSSIVGRLITNAKYRDVSAWYHIVAVWDSANGTAGNRMRLYVNGTEVTSFSTDTNPSSGANATFGNTSHPIEIGRRGSNGTQYFDGYIAEVAVCDGQAYAASDFGEFDEDSPTIWKPKDISGLTFGTSGFYLDFENSSNLGNDANGGTDLTEVNLAATDQASDSPTNNFATINPLDNYYGAKTFSEGNLQQVDPSGNSYSSHTTIGVSNGKWYAEAKLTAQGADQTLIGISSNQSTATGFHLGKGATSYGMYSNTGSYYTNNGSANSYGVSYTTNDIIGIYLDLDNNKLYFAKNGTIMNSGTGISITDPASTELGAYFFSAMQWDNATSATWQFNFGSPIFSISSGNADKNGYGSFEYDPSDGGGSSFDSSAKDFYALCTKNLAEFG